MRNEKEIGLKRRLIISQLAFPILLLALLIAGFLLKGKLSLLFSQKEDLRNWVFSYGTAGWFVFMILQIFQVMVFVIPGKVTQLAGGFIFSFWDGLALTSMRIALGSAVNFWLGRAMGSSSLMAILKTDQYEKLRKFSEDAQTFAGIIFLFVIPSIPKDLLCYFVGASVQRFFLFLWHR